MNAVRTGFAATLVSQSSLLVRLLFNTVDTDLTRTEAGVMRSLDERPHRITELAARESLAQPTVTAVVAALERRGYVRRERDATDGRAVVVSLTEAGHEARTALLDALAGPLEHALATLEPEQVAAIRAATDALGPLTQALQKGASA